VSRDSSVSIVTRLRVVRQGPVSRQKLRFLLFVTPSRPALGPTQPPIQCVPGVKKPGCESDHPPSSSAEVNNTWSNTSTPPYVFIAWCLVKHRHNFTVTLPINKQIRGCIQKFPDWVHSEIYAYNNKHSFRNNKKGCADKTHYTDSGNGHTTAPSGRELYHLLFSLQAAGPGTFGYTSYGRFERWSLLQNNMWRWTSS
jgi:hypothetical protein